jgi:hypothetical protein
LFQRLAPAKHGIGEPQGSSASGETWNIHAAPLEEIALEGQHAHLMAMDNPTKIPAISSSTSRATTRPAPFAKPAHWSNAPAPLPQAPKADDDPAGLSPTRYGDWVRDGIAVDF